MKIKDIFEEVFGEELAPGDEVSNIVSDINDHLAASKEGEEKLRGILKQISDQQEKNASDALENEKLKKELEKKEQELKKSGDKLTVGQQKLASDKQKFAMSQQKSAVKPATTTVSSPVSTSMKVEN